MKITITVCSLCLLVFAGCLGIPDIPDDMPPLAILKSAQSEIFAERWDRALHYYNTYLERYPDDFVVGIEVRYEIAYIYYLRNETEQAKILFQDIIQEYETTDNNLPLWTKVLSEKILTLITEEEQDG